jgi:hypothetical protein
MTKPDSTAQAETAPAADVSELEDLLTKSAQHGAASVGRDAASVGELLALLNNGHTPVVALKGHDAIAVRGRTTIDLHSDHIGQQVVLLFEDGDQQRPIVVGVVRTDRTAVPPELAGNVDVTADGERMIVSAHRELVLECGKASITLQQDGTVRIVGERILSRSTGPNRVQGGSVQLN